MARTRLAVSRVDQLAQDAAVSYPVAACALRAERCQLRLQRLKRHALGAYPFEMAPDQLVDVVARDLLVARKIDQPLDLSERHIERAAVPDEIEPLDVRRSIRPVSRRRARRGVEQPFALVVAHR